MLNDVWYMSGGTNEGEPEGQTEGEGESCSGACHTADQDHNGRISLSELLRIIQFYFTGPYHCDPSGEDGFAPGPGDTSCVPHNADFTPQDWTISLSELLRIIQLYNSDGYHACSTTEDGFCPGPA